MTTLAEVTASAVREALERRDIRQRAVGPVLGLSQAAVSDRLRGRTPFTLADLERLAAHLGVPVTDFVQPSTLERAR